MRFRQYWWMCPQPDSSSVSRGYPIDCRTPAQISRCAQSPHGDFERTAARVVARLTGEPVFLQDDGSEDRMPDIRIEHLGRGPDYVEVWTDTDPDYAAMEARLLKPKKELPLELAAPGLSRVWWVVVSGATKIDQLEAEVEEVLSRLERGGVTFERVAELTSSDDPGAKRLLHLGVIRISSRPCTPDELGTIRVSPAGISGSPTISWETVFAWLSQTLFSARLKDVRSKLAATGSTERHLFLGSTFTSPSDVFFALDDYRRGLPHEPPKLPQEITHLWLMRASCPGRCIAWFPERGWFDVSRHWATA